MVYDMSTVAWKLSLEVVLPTPLQACSQELNVIRSDLFLPLSSTFSLPIACFTITLILIKRSTKYFSNTITDFCKRAVSYGSVGARAETHAPWQGGLRRPRKTYKEGITKTGEENAGFRAPRCRFSQISE